MFVDVIAAFIGCQFVTSCTSRRAGDPVVGRTGTPAPRLSLQRAKKGCTKLISTRDYPVPNRTHISKVLRKTFAARPVARLEVHLQVNGWTTSGT